jgi:alkyl sulfatase BDS1-like metallo-beta-lactamase superfamily hydrolase
MYIVANEFDVQGCFDLADKLSSLALDLRFTQDQQEVFLTYSDEVLKYAKKIQHKQFEDGLYILKDAGTALAAANDRIDEATNKLEKMAGALRTVDQVLMNLSEFLRIIALI